MKKRRLYDVTSVLEGIGLIEKKSLNMIQWEYGNAYTINFLHWSLSFKFHFVQDYSIKKSYDSILLLHRGLDVSRPGEVDESVTSLQVWRTISMPVFFLILLIVNWPCHNLPSSLSKRISIIGLCCLYRQE